MGGCKTYGGGTTYQTTRSPENCWTPSKRASGLLCCGFLYRKNRAMTPEKGGEKGGGPKPLSGKGVIREDVFHPLFPPPPWRPLRNIGRPLMHHQNVSLQKCTIKTYFFDLLSWGGPAFDLFNEVKRVRFDGAFCSDTF